MNRARLLSNRRKTKKGFKISRQKVTAILRVLVILIFIGSLFIGIPRLIPIHAIKCETESGECSPNLIAKINTVKPSNFSKTKTQVSRVLNEEVSVKNYSIRFQLPGTFVIYVIERTPVVAIAKEGATSDFAFVDDEGFIVGVWESTNLPILVVSRDSEYHVGQKLPENIKFSILVTDQAYKKYDSRLVMLKSDLLEVELPSGIKAIFPISGDADLLFGSLSLILNNLNSDTIMLLPSIIDLRYKNPVIR